MNRTRHFLLILATLLLCVSSTAKPIKSTSAQSVDSDKIYTRNEVDVRARVKNELDHLPDAKNDCPVPVRVTLRVVLRKSGKVTDITVLKTSGCSYDQEVIKVVKKLKFNPAIKGGQRVSQYSEIEYATTATTR
jgi:TonB family protein